MLERATLHVLAEAAEIGLPEAAVVPAAAYDPFLRPALKRRVRRAVDDALARTGERATGDHVLRVAFLSRHPRAPQGLDPKDERAVAQAYAPLAEEFLPPRPKGHDVPHGGAYRAAAPERVEPFAVAPKRKKRFWPITTPLVCAVLLGGGATAAVIAVPYLIPSKVARFRKTAAGRALADPLTDWIAGDRSPTTRGNILAPEVKRQVGGDAFAALEQTVDAVPVVSRSDVPNIDDAAAPLFASINTTNARLAKAKVPVLLHGYVAGAPGRRAAWITSYFVEQRDDLRWEGGTYAVAWGRRLDGLNLLDSNVYKANAEDWIVLSVEKVEEEFVQTLLSPIATGSPMAPADLDERDGSPRAALAKTAGRVVGEEVKKASGLSTSDADGLRRAIARRNEAAVGLAKVGYRINASSRIELEPHTVRRLERSAANAGRDEKALFDELLQMNERMSLYQRAVAPAVAELARIEEEELTARLEAERRLGGASVARLADEEVDTKRGRGVASAELGMLARAQACPRLALMRVAHLVLEPNDFSGADVEVSRVVLLELLVELGLLPKAAPGVDDAFLGALRAALELPPDRVRAAAGKAYERVFGRPPPALARSTR